VKRRTRPPNKYTPPDTQKLKKNHTLQTAKLEQEVHVDDDMNHKKPEARPTRNCDDAGVNQQMNKNSQNKAQTKRGKLKVNTVNPEDVDFGPTPSFQNEYGTVSDHDDDEQCDSGADEKTPLCDQCGVEYVTTSCLECKSSECDACSFMLHKSGTRARHSRVPWTSAPAIMQDKVQQEHPVRPLGLDMRNVGAAKPNNPNNPNKVGAAKPVVNTGHISGAEKKPTAKVNWRSNEKAMIEANDELVSLYVVYSPWAPSVDEDTGEFSYTWGKIKEKHEIVAREFTPFPITGNIAKEHIHTLMHTARKTRTLMQTQKRTNMGGSGSDDIPILTQRERHLQEVISQEDRYNAFFENKKSKKGVIMEMKAEAGKLCMDAAISLHAKETSKKRKRSSAESPDKSDNDEVLTTQARKAADAQAPFLKALEENRQERNESTKTFSKLLESIATNRQQMLEKLEAEKAKDDEKEKEAMKSEKLFQKTLLMLQARSMGIDVNDLMQL
jgi:hypothetical protein